MSAAPAPAPGGDQLLERALALAFRYLGSRDRTVAQVRAHLGRSRVDPGTVATAVESLTRDGYLDDARYAQRFAEDRRRLDGWGSERIERALRAAGVAPRDFSPVLEAHSPEAERDAAFEVLARRVRRPPRDEVERQRALALLVRRGYDLETAYDAVRAFAGEATG